MRTQIMEGSSLRLRRSHQTFCQVGWRRSKLEKGNKNQLSDCKIEINVSHFCFIVHWTNEEIHH